MKRLIVLSALLATGLLYANETNSSTYSSIVETNAVKAETNYFGGWCEIKIWRGSTLVGYSYTYEDSEAMCSSKATIMLLQKMSEQ